MKASFAAAIALLFADNAVAAPSHRRRNWPSSNAGSQPRIRSNSTSLHSFVAEDDTAKEYDNNWAGAVQVYSGITEVSATSNVPEVAAPPGGYSGTTYGGVSWVGIDGNTCSRAILQTGVEWLIQDGQVEYYAWYEWYPAPFYHFQNFAISAGDEIFMRVVATSQTSGTAYITNRNTGQSVSKSFYNQPALCLENAEWIVEDFQSGGDLFPFAQFSPVAFTDATWVANGNRYGVSGSQVIDIEQNGRILADCNLNGNTEVDCSYG